jgi:hypothetical protein
MVSKPDLKLFAWSTALGGLGVVGREGIGVADREIIPLSLVSFDFFEDPSFQDIIYWFGRLPERCKWVKLRVVNNGERDYEFRDWLC